MASVIADHPPRELAAELAGLLRVDWRSVWPGVPDDEAGRAEWCAGFGWRPLWSQSGLWVRTARGGRLHLASRAGLGRPVTRASYTVWKATADAASDGEAVLAVGLDRYAAHLAGVSAALGAPGWEGAWDSPDFPEPLAPGRWDDVQELRSPYRLAQWRYANPLTAPSGPVPAAGVARAPAALTPRSTATGMDGPA